MTRALIALAALGLVGCAQGNPAAQRQTEATLKMTNEADRMVGMPAISNFAERKLVRDVLERRDRASTTYAYLQGLDGRLTCLGQGIGYGVPYGAQFTAPRSLQWLRATDGDGSTSNATTEVMDQPEPNGLYMPDNASATWWQMLNPSTGRVEVVYLEPSVTVTPFKLSGPIVAADCPA